MFWYMSLTNERSSFVIIVLYCAHFVKFLNDNFQQASFEIIQLSWSKLVRILVKVLVLITQDESKRYTFHPRMFQMSRIPPRFHLKNAETK
jgi:DNA polymerase III sliding clamp (beta) subunit (PCNA family)